MKKRSKKIHLALTAFLLAAFIAIVACSNGGYEKHAAPDPDCPASAGGQKTASGACPDPDVSITRD